MLTLWLLVFSAHHAAPDAPIWHGDSGHSGSHSASGHAHQHGLEQRSLEDQLEASSTPDLPAFTAPHDHAHDHCELCFNAAFQVSAIPSAVLRPNPIGELSAQPRGAERRFLETGLPDAHAPPTA